MKDQKTLTRVNYLLPHLFAQVIPTGKQVVISSRSPGFRMEMHSFDGALQVVLFSGGMRDQET